MTPGRSAIGLSLVVMAETCLPALGPGDSLVESTRILAIRADPAEAQPGTPVTFTPVVASPSGTVADAAIVWSFCTEPKPLTEDNIVSTACLGTSARVAAGSGPNVIAIVPPDACSVFGPDTPSANLRPPDPDSTGGYYQPLLAELAGADTAVDPFRIRCALANADAQAASAFAAAYHPNQNPQLLPIASIAGSAPGHAEVERAARVTLEASWPAASAETYVEFDPATQAVTSQRESMQVAWFANDGVLDTESTGRASTDLATTSDNGWTAPATPGVTHFWVVLRDSRGGVDFAEYEVLVQ